MSRWTLAEDRLIRDNWRTMSDLQLSDLLPGRSVNAIHQHRAMDLLLNKRKPRYVESTYAPDRSGLTVRHGTLPDNPITDEHRREIDYLRKTRGTYNDGRRIKCT